MSYFSPSILPKAVGRPGIFVYRVKHKQQPKWLAPGIIDAIKTRARYKSLNNETQHKIWRNRVAGVINQSKKLTTHQ